ncbi:hypothetical protein [Streptomyces sp. NPDC005805]|uniref:hypothetical protein n=1 Tax=Streptomyces sp. NPDC005805 TaxID=3157068 RepID=UPI0033C627C4
MTDEDVARARWGLPQDERTYEDAVAGLIDENEVVRAYLAAGVDLDLLRAELFGHRFVAHVLASGRGEYADYQDAVEQRELAARRRGTQSFPRRVLRPLRTVLLDLQVALMRRQWQDALPAELAREVGGVLQLLLGEDHSRLLVTPDILGLVDAHDLRYFVPHDELDDLNTKLGLMSGGTVAVSGPRGVGKSTLLRALVETAEPHDLIVPVQMPAAYVPQEFLLSLFQRVCEEFLAQYDDERAGAFPVLVRLRKHLLKRLRRLSRRVLQATAAVLLLSVALAPLFHAIQEALRAGFYPWLSQSWTATARAATLAWAESPWVTRTPLAVLGIALLTTLPRKRRRSPLLQDCVNYLYLLRTVQSTSLAVNTGFAPLVAGTLGAGRTTTLSSRNLTLPELVVHFRRMLGEMTEHGAGTDEGPQRIFILVDEVDRIGSAEQARALLAEIKAVFGVSHVYFLLSVAEEIGAGFVRRGMPVRDVLDSSLDDVIHVVPRSLEQSHRILQSRVPGLPSPFIALAHCLSGGITRDLIRFTRCMVAIPERIGPGGGRLPRVALTLLLDEFQKSLRSFRVALGEADGVDGYRLDDIRLTLTGVWERGVDESVEEAANTVRKLLEVADSRALSQERDSADDVVQGWSEVAAYADFILAMIEFFAVARRFPDEYAMRRKGPEGQLDRLAEARLDLEVSPRSSRLLLERFRKAWSLSGSTEEAQVQT